MADCPILNSISTIPREECIGNSLSRINDNFNFLKNQTCTNYNQIEGLDASILALQTLTNNLSSIAYSGAAKAWVKFDGTRDNGGNLNLTSGTDRFIYSSYNISSVYKNNVGDYKITFLEGFSEIPPFVSRSYTVVGTSSEVLSQGGEYTWVQPYRYSDDSFNVRVHGNTQTDTADPTHISLIVF